MEKLVAVEANEPVSYNLGLSWRRGDFSLLRDFILHYHNLLFSPSVSKALLRGSTILLSDLLSPWPGGRSQWFSVLRMRLKIREVCKLWVPLAPNSEVEPRFLAFQFSYLPTPRNHKQGIRTETTTRTPGAKSSSAGNQRALAFQKPWAEPPHLRDHPRYISMPPTTCLSLFQCSTSLNSFGPHNRLMKRKWCSSSLHRWGSWVRRRLRICSALPAGKWQSWSPGRQAGAKAQTAPPTLGRRQDAVPRRRQAQWDAHTLCGSERHREHRTLCFQFNTTLNVVVRR